MASCAWSGSQSLERIYLPHIGHWARSSMPNGPCTVRRHETRFGPSVSARSGRMASSAARSGAFKEEKETSDAGYVQKELSRGKLSRSFSPPTAIKADAAKAEFKDGLLTLTLPKTEEVRPTHVKVQVS